MINGLRYRVLWRVVFRASTIKTVLTDRLNIAVRVMKSSEKIVLCSTAMTMDSQMVLPSQKR
jgi:hypothetical protein